MAGENIGKISSLDHLEEKTLANGLQMKAMDIEYYVNLREKLWQLANNLLNLPTFSPANVFCYTV